MVMMMKGVESDDMQSDFCSELAYHEAPQLSFIHLSPHQSKNKVPIRATGKSSELVS